MLKKDSNTGQENGDMISTTLPRFFQPFQCDDIIRLGKSNDGGYLVSTHDVFTTDHLLSFGIGKDWSFEKDFVGIIDCPLDAYDKSLNDVMLADNMALKDSYNKFFTGNRKHIEKNIGPSVDDVGFDVFDLPDNTFLKCDIEGSEYDILDDVIIRSKKFSGMVLEFHEVEHQENLFRIVDFMSKIDQKLIHIHINNWWYFITDDGGCVPSCIEMTFSSSPNISLNKKLTLPHKLDMKNNPDGKLIQIAFN